MNEDIYPNPPKEDHDFVLRRYPVIVEIRVFLRKEFIEIFESHLGIPSNYPRAKAHPRPIQIYKLRNEKDMYKRQFPDRMTLLQNMGFEWEHSAVPEEWELIVMGGCCTGSAMGMCSLAHYFQMV